MCQKATGGFFAALVGVPLEALAWTAGTPATFRSSDIALRGFRRECGTPLFHDRPEAGHVSLSIAAFDAPAAHALVLELGAEAALPQMARPGAGTQYRLSDLVGG